MKRNGVKVCCEAPNQGFVPHLIGIHLQNTTQIIWQSISKVQGLRNSIKCLLEEKGLLM